MYRYALTLACLLPFLANAQDQSVVDRLLKQQEEVFTKYTISANGATNPEAIPFAVVVEAAFFRFARESEQTDAFRRMLQERFGGNEADRELITELARGAYQVAEESRNNDVKAYDEICTKVLNAEPWNSLNAVEVAREFQAVENKRMEKTEQHYRQAIEQLSPTARSALLSYIDTNVRSSIHWSTLDIVGLATEIPENWLYNTRLSCERRLALPPSKRMWRVHEPQRQTLQ